MNVLKGIKQRKENPTMKADGWGGLLRDRSCRLSHSVMVQQCYENINNCHQLYWKENSKSVYLPVEQRHYNTVMDGIMDNRTTTGDTHCSSEVKLF